MQKEYMQGSYHTGGGKTGMARRLSWEEPCLVILLNSIEAGLNSD
jgi:DNA (cytosine-5)-methyltransferase 1